MQDPESNVCTRCGEDQVLGTLIFSALGMCGTFGAFFLSLLYLSLVEQGMRGPREAVQGARHRNVSRATSHCQSLSPHLRKMLSDPIFKGQIKLYIARG